MRHVDAMTFFRPFVAGLLLATPFAVGCGTKNEKVDEAPIASANAQPAAAPDLDISPGREATDAEQPVAPAEPAAAPDLAPNGVPDDSTATPRSADAVDAAESEEADRPRSIFRSIGRALQKGLTDATSGESAAEDDASEPADTNADDPLTVQPR